MPTAKDIRCTVHTKDGPLQEYHDNKSRSSASSSVDFYIQAENASTFWIECEVLPSYQYTVGDRVSFATYVDGNFARRAGVNQQCPCAKIGGVISGKFIEPFKFSKLLLVEGYDPASCINEDSLDCTGEISVYVLRSQFTRPDKRPGQSIILNLKLSVDEKSLKGREITHSIELGRPEKHNKLIKSVKIKKLDRIQNPYIHFRILYRSKEALQNLGLIPRTPLPSPTPESRASFLRLAQEAAASGLPTNFVTQEMAKLRAQLASLESYLKAKREVKLEESRDQQTAAGDSRVKRRKLSNGDRSQKSKAIDLTVDD